MEITVTRFSDNGESTLGLFSINDEFACYTLEDEKREYKIHGDTRIPNGTYCVGLRTEGGFHNRYLNRFGSKFHKGMLEVQNVPNFEFILIHVGNTDDNTEGCLLVGDQLNNNVVQDGFVGSSVQAYKRIYPVIKDAVLQGEDVTITYEEL